MARAESNAVYVAGDRNEDRLVLGLVKQQDATMRVFHSDIICKLNALCALVEDTRSRIAPRGGVLRNRSGGARLWRRTRRK
jgi:hypothetical protein